LGALLRERGRVTIVVDVDELLDVVAVVVVLVVLVVVVVVLAVFVAVDASRSPLAGIVTIGELGTDTDRLPDSVGEPSLAERFNGGTLIAA
jgi:hypothetical protein